MARQRPSHLKKTFNAQRVFTDREKPRAAFANALAKPQTENDFRVLNFHGIGGQGKTALCEQFIKSLGKEKQNNSQLGWAQLDFEVSEYRSVANALLTIRLQLAEHAVSLFLPLIPPLHGIFPIPAKAIIFTMLTPIYSNNLMIFFKM